MTRRLAAMSLCALVSGTPLYAQPDDQNTPPPEAIAQYCIHHMTHITHRTVRQMHKIANHGVDVITELLENGEQQQAEQAAANHIQAINQLAQQRISGIAQLAQECVETLIELDAPAALIQQVQQAAQARSALIQERRMIEIARIEEALQG